jgi:capsular polysaccharide biosynthesis protein
MTETKGRPPGPSTSITRRAPAAIQQSWPETMDETQRRGKSVFGVLQRRRAWIVLTFIACVAIAALITVIKPPTYQATVLLVVDQRATAPTADLNATITTGELLAAHYTKMASTVTVLDRVCAEAGGSCTFDSLKAHATLATVKGTDLLAVSVTDASPSRAALLANVLAAQLIVEERAEIAAALEPTKAYLEGELASLRSEITTTTKPALLAVVQAQYTTVYTRQEAVAEQESRLDGELATVEAAGVPSVPTDPDPKLYLPAGLVVGMVLAGILALVVDWFDDRIFSAEGLSDATGVPLVVAC